MSVNPGAVALIADNVAAARGPRVLFEQASFTVRAGEMLELRGPNGSGKSTLLRILAGLTRPMAGHVRIEGVATADRDAPALHFLGHSDAVKPNETAQQQARFWSAFYGHRQDAARAAMLRVGLSKRTEVPGRGLSAGQKRRLALARLLIEPRPIWLLDEPMASLDAEGRALVEELVREHVAAGGLIVAAMHAEAFAGARAFEVTAPAPDRRTVDGY